MKVEYETEKVLELCTRRKAAQRRFGEPGAKRLARRIKELESAVDSRDLFEGGGHWHPLHGDRAGTWSATVTSSDRIVVSFASTGTLVVVLAVGNEYH